METIIESIKKVTVSELEKFSNDTKFQEFNNFLSEMKINGNIIKKTYTLPPLDTIGKRLYQNNSKPL
jgi:hypothetical protein